MNTIKIVFNESLRFARDDFIHINRNIYFSYILMEIIKYYGIKIQFLLS